MKITSNGATVNVSDLSELANGNSDAFQTAVRAALPPGIKQIEIDFSRVGFFDCGGIGALVGVRNAVLGDDITVRILNPSGQVRRMFRLTRMEELFPIDCR